MIDATKPCALHPNRSALIVTCDGLGARSLGPYGQRAVTTPHIDRMAGDGLLFENAMSCPGLFPWDGQGQNRGALQRFLKPLRRLTESALTTCLISDDPDWVSANADCFSTAVCLPGDSVVAPADDMWETALARTFAQLGDVMEHLPQRSLVWLHVAHLARVWDAPMSVRALLTGEDEPPPLDGIHPPTGPIGPADEDRIWQWRTVYAAQMVVLDWCWGVMQQQLDEWQARRGPLLTMLMGTSGYPLGEHGQAGRAAHCPYHEALHVPILIQPGLPGEFGVRLRNLTDVGQGLEWVLSWFSGSAEARGEMKSPAIWPFSTPQTAPNLGGERWVSPNSVGWVPELGREVWWGMIGGRKVVRTHGWHLVEGEASAELYLKPDDRWDQNDVHRRCPQVVEGLQSLWQQLQALDRQGAVCLASELPSELVSFS